MRRACHGWRGIALALAILSGGCGGSVEQGGEPAPAPRDLVVITLDTVRADRIGAYGDPLARTPNLDDFAAHGALFREAWTPTPLTLPAHTSLLSGQPPRVHGVRDNGGYRVPGDLPLVQERLRAAGWHTGAFVSAFVLDRTWGLDRGFDAYAAPFHPEDVSSAPFGALERPGREVVREALAWWEATPAPRMMWVHLYEAHYPWAPDPAWVGDPYRGEVWEVDRALRPLLSATEGALVVIAADHGEGLWDEGELEHGLVLSRSTVRVPLLIRPPGGLAQGAPAEARSAPPRPEGWAPSGSWAQTGLTLEAVPDAPRAARVVEEPVSLLDVAPTLLDAAGLDHGDLPGRTLLPALDGGPLPPGVIASETWYPALHYGWAPAAAARVGQRALRVSPGALLWDPVEDPWGQRPLDGAAPEALSAAVMLPAPAAPSLPQAEELERLRALGYASGGAAAPGTLDAREGLPLLYRLRAAEAARASDPEGARAALEALIAEAPELLDGWFTLALWRALDGHPDEALAAWEALLERSPGNPLALHGRAAQLRSLGRNDEAAALARELERINPADGRAWRLEASLAARREAPAEVVDIATRGLSANPGDAFLHYLRGLARLQLGEPAGAEEDLALARAHGSRAGDIALWEGQAALAQGQLDRAVAAWRAAALAHPEDLRPTVTAGVALAEVGRCEEALPFLHTARSRRVQEPALDAAWARCGGTTSR
ncbi:MAG: sulfatase-like hydrolase/transferase [Deltaproteobacteria bacterium]|nr:sulfatase-like hydrolase/transferase [Deltaproteobacteria bacterium]